MYLGLFIDIQLLSELCLPSGNKEVCLLKDIPSGMVTTVESPSLAFTSHSVTCEQQLSSSRSSVTLHHKHQNAFIIIIYSIFYAVSFFFCSFFRPETLNLTQVLQPSLSALLTSALFSILFILLHYPI